MDPIAPSPAQPTAPLTLSSVSPAPEGARGEREPGTLRALTQGVRTKLCSRNWLRLVHGRSDGQEYLRDMLEALPPSGLGIALLSLAGQPAPAGPLFFVLGLAGVSLTGLGLLRAVARRLHDTGRSVSVLRPLLLIAGTAFLAAALVSMVLETIPGQILRLSVNWTLLLGGLAWLVWLGRLPGVAGSNRYGTPPAAGGPAASLCPEN